jgi:hypothetical protein
MAFPCTNISKQMDRSDTRSFLEDYIVTLRQAIAFLWMQIRRNILSFLLVILIAIGAGFAYWYRVTPYYESDLVCSYNNERFGRKTFGEMAQKINILAQSGSSKEMAKLLNITPEQAAAVVSLDAKNRSGSPLFEDITGDNQALYFTLKATDRAVFEPFQAGLVNYLSTTPYQREIGAIQLAKIDQKIAYIAGDIRKADSIIDAYTVAIRNGLVFRDTVKNSSDVTDMLNYKNTLEDYITHHVQRKALESGPSLMVMHGFTPADKPSRGSRKVILGFAIIGLVAATCWAVLRDNKKPVHA